MKILYMGTPEFAVAPLKAILDTEHIVCAVVTQPDKPKGRGYVLTPPEVKVCAVENNIPVYQPQSLKDNALLPILDEYKPDIIVVVAYGKILPEYILNYPKYGCVNVHASLLPKYRGAAPINWCIINGEATTGVTTMYMEKGLDTGDMLEKSTVDITDDDTAGTLHDKLMEKGAMLIVSTLEKIADSSISPQKQDDSSFTYAPTFNKENTKIDFNKKAKEIVDLVRGLNPFPTAHTKLEDKIVKVYSASAVECSTNAKNGTIISSDKTILVKCADGAVSIDELLIQGSKRMKTGEFLKGRTIEIGKMFE